MTALAIRFDLRNPSFVGIDTADRFRAAIEMCEWADRVGFDTVILSEHHGAADEYLSSIFPLAAAVAARTERIQLLLGAVVAPFHHPLRLAEDLVGIDHISRGRLTVALANGYVPSEFEMFDVDLRDRVRLVERTVRALRQAWTGEPFEFDGRTVRVTPAPYRPGGPPILLAGSSEGAARRAAHIADGFFPSLAEFWEPYRQECLALGKPDPGPGAPIPPMYFHLTDDPEATWPEVAPYALHEMNAYGRWAAESAAATGYEAMSDIELLRSFGQHRVLTPDEMVAYAHQFGYVLLNPMMGGVPPEMAWENLHRFEHEVLGRIR